MGLETAEFISELVGTNPVNTDKKRQGDDHLRLIKLALQATFPNADKAFYFPVSEAKTSSFSVVATEMNKTFMVSTASGEVTATLPALTADDDGWCCHFIKTNTGTNALFIAPNSGTLQSGEVTALTKCRRVIPGHRCTATWDGTGWFVTRVPSVPVGSIISFCGSSLPVGYEWPNGQTLSNASTKYLEFYAVNGNSGVVVDKRGRVTAGKDDMGGSSANRLTNQTGGLNGDTLGATGGAETHTLSEGQLPSHTHGNGTLAAASDGSHTHLTVRNATGTLALSNSNYLGRVGDGNGVDNASYTLEGHASEADVGLTSSNGAHTHSLSGTMAAVGSGEAHNNVQPTIILNEILVVE